jgi:serine/threonine protein kinase
VNDSDCDEVSLGFEPTSPGRVLESLARSIGSIPRVLLPDTANDDQGVAVIKPSSPEMPGPSERGDRYQLFGEIARGGMGAVLKGRDPDLGRDLAVKVLLEGHRDKPDLLRRFVEEAQIGGQLQHPGIVPVYELGTFADRRPYFTMKLVKGRTLAQLLKERDVRPDPSPVGAGSGQRSVGSRVRSEAEPPPTESPSTGVLADLPRLLAIFEQVCQTVAYAHARGVIHRDLKPTNIMVGGFGEV